MRRCWVCKQVGSTKVWEMVEDYFDEGLGIYFDTVCDWDSMDACISWTRMHTPIGSEVRTQLDQDHDFLNCSE